MGGSIEPLNSNEIETGRRPESTGPAADGGGTAAYPGIGGAIWLVIVIFLVSMAGGLIVRLLGLAEVQLVKLIGEMVGPTALVAWYGWRRRAPSARLLVFMPRVRMQALGALILALPGFWIVHFQSLALFTIVLPIPESLAEMMADRFAGPWLPITVLLLAAAYVEEVVFRGVILAGLLERYSALRAILLSALLFGIAHLLPWSIVSSFAGGVLLGWLYYRTRSIVLCAAVHLVHNLVSETFLREVGRAAGVELFTVSHPAFPLLPAWLVLLGAAVAAAGFLLADRGLRDRVLENA